MNKKELTIVGVVGVIGLWYVSRKIGNAAEAAIDAVNPLNQDNIAYSGVNAVGEALTGNQNWTLGGAIYDGVDWTRGLWGDSDADRLAAIEADAARRAKAQQEALQKYYLTGGF